MSSSDETFLEFFIENISTLPNEVKRNFDLMKNLDKLCSTNCDHLRECEAKYVREAEKRIMENIQVSTDYKLRRKAIDDNNSATKMNEENEYKMEGFVVKDTSGEALMMVPTTEELRLMIQNPLALAQIAKLRQTARQVADEKVSIAVQTHRIVDHVVKRLDTDLEKFKGLLKGSGQFEIAAVANPDDLAAIQVTPNSPDWILAKVILHDEHTGLYNLSDEDIESNKNFTLPEAQVVILGGVDRLVRGDVIHAVYPDTTSFYQATVVQPPRKVSGGESFVMVNFKDDGDENGITHDKAVLMKHVMRVPYGAL